MFLQNLVCLRRARSGECGATATEYAIMVGFIAIVIVATVATLGTQVAKLIEPTIDALR